jgi:TRAP-type C4-dicarboxylate transport system permease small subunit
MMTAIMGIVTLDVVMRYLLRSPLWWAYDLIGVYLMCGIFFLLLSRTFWLNAHIAVDLFQKRFSAQLRRASQALVCGVCGATFLAITYATLLATHDAYEAADVTASGNWPVWPALALAPIGCGILGVRLLLSLAAELYSLVRGIDVIAIFQNDAPLETPE